MSCFVVWRSCARDVIRWWGCDWLGGVGRPLHGGVVYADALKKEF